MKTYSFSAAALARSRRVMLRSMLPLLAMVVGIVVVTMFAQGSMTWQGLLFAAPLVLALWGFGVYVGVQQQMSILSSVHIELGEDYISRSQVRVPAVRITRAEITSVDEIPGGLCVRTSDPARSLAVPELLGEAEFQEIRAALTNWVPIKPRSAQTRAKSLATTVLLLAGFGVIFFAQSPWLVLAAAGAVFAYCLYVYRLLGRSPGVDPKFRRSFLLILVFLVLITLSRLVPFLLI